MQLGGAPGGTEEPLVRPHPPFHKHELLCHTNVGGGVIMSCGALRQQRITIPFVNINRIYCVSDNFIYSFII